MVPVRSTTPLLDWTEYSTVPPPIPLAPAVMVIQDAELDAVRAEVQLAGVVVTVMTPVPPWLVKIWLAGLMLNDEHVCACSAGASAETNAIADAILSRPMEHAMLRSTIFSHPVQHRSRYNGHYSDHC